MISLVNRDDSEQANIRERVQVSCSMWCSIARRSTIQSHPLLVQAQQRGWLLQQWWAGSGSLLWERRGHWRGRFVGRLAAGSCCWRVLELPYSICTRLESEIDAEVGSLS